MDKDLTVQKFTTELIGLIKNYFPNIVDEYTGAHSELELNDITQISLELDRKNPYFKLELGYTKLEKNFYNTKQVTNF